MLLPDLLVGEEGFGDVGPVSWLAQLCLSLMSVSLHLPRKCAGLRDILLDLLTMRSCRFRVRGASLITSLYEANQI